MYFVSSLARSKDGSGADHHGQVWRYERDARVYGLTQQGEVYPMARNAQNTGTSEEPEYGEFAGVTFSPDGATMYVNCYAPGTTFAVTGPWR